MTFRVIVSARVMFYLSAIIAGMSVHESDGYLHCRKEKNEVCVCVLSEYTYLWGKNASSNTLHMEHVMPFIKDHISQNAPGRYIFSKKTPFSTFISKNTPHLPSKHSRDDNAGMSRTMFLAVHMS